jgi:integrase
VKLLTAQRRDEIAGLRWSELSDDLTVWILPADRAKNGREHVVHLSDETRAVLAAVPRLVGADLVFTTTGTTPVSGFSKAIARLTVAAETVRIKQVTDAGQRALAPMPTWRLHDFRRTCVTWLAGAGFPPHVADKLLNHVAVSGLSDVGRVYQRGAFLPERMAALEAWGKYVVACAEGRAASDNVIALGVKGWRKIGA